MSGFRISRRFLVILLLGLIIPLSGFSQRETMTVFLTVPKPVIMPGERIWYGMALDNFLLRENRYPVIHGSLSDRNGTILDRWSIRPDSAFWIGQHATGESLTPGSYILSLALWNETYTQVLEECDQVIQVLGKADQKYFLFKDNIEPVTANEPIPESSIDKQICLERQPGMSLGWVGLQEWLPLSSWRSYRAADLSTRYGYELGIHLDQANLDGKVTAYDINSLQALPMDLEEQQGSFMVADFEGRKDFQFIRLTDGQLLDLPPAMLPPSLWQPDDLMPADVPESLYNALLEKEEKRTLVAHIFNYMQPAIPIDTTVTVLSQYDDEYDLSKYLAFESLELFIREVILPLKIINKRNNHSIRVLNADVKNWFDDAPKLMINGVFQPDIKQLFEIPFDQCTAIRLYRSLNTTRQRFGPIARNGIIEIITKPSYVTGSKPINITGLTKGSNYEWFKPGKAQGATPVLVPVPMLQVVKDSPGCYLHSDESGVFRYTECRLENRHLVQSVKDFKVK